MTAGNRPSSPRFRGAYPNRVSVSLVGTAAAQPAQDTDILTLRLEQAHIDGLRKTWTIEPHGEAAAPVMPDRFFHAAPNSVDQGEAGRKTGPSSTGSQDEGDKPHALDVSMFGHLPKGAGEAVFGANESARSIAAMS